MIWIELKRWNQQFDRPKVIKRIRKKIAGRIRQGECIILSSEGATGIDESSWEKISEGWPMEKVKLVPPRTG